MCACAPLSSLHRGLVQTRFGADRWDIGAGTAAEDLPFPVWQDRRPLTGILFFPDALAHVLIYREAKGLNFIHENFIAHFVLFYFLVMKNSLINFPAAQFSQLHLRLTTIDFTYLSIFGVSVRHDFPLDA